MAMFNNQRVYVVYILINMCIYIYKHGCFTEMSYYCFTMDFMGLMGEKHGSNVGILIRSTIPNFTIN